MVLGRNSQMSPLLPQEASLTDKLRFKKTIHPYVTLHVVRKSEVVEEVAMCNEPVRSSKWPEKPALPQQLTPNSVRLDTDSVGRVMQMKN